jgi:hypothetical protein
MKTLATCCLALVLLFAVCGSGFCSPSVEQQVKALEEQLILLEGVYNQTVAELQAVSREAKPAFDEADKILKANPKQQNLTLTSKYKIILAAYYEQYIARLKLTLQVIVQQGYITNEKLKTLKKMKEA